MDFLFIEHEVKDERADFHRWNTIRRNILPRRCDWHTLFKCELWSQTHDIISVYGDSLPDATFFVVSLSSLVARSTWDVWCYCGGCRPSVFSYLEEMWSTLHLIHQSSDDAVHVVAGFPPPPPPVHAISHDMITKYTYMKDVPWKEHS